MAEYYVIPKKMQWIRTVLVMIKRRIDSADTFRTSTAICRMSRTNPMNHPAFPPGLDTKETGKIVLKKKNANRPVLVYSPQSYKLNCGYDS